MVTVQVWLGKNCLVTRPHKLLSEVDQSDGYVFIIFHKVVFANDKAVILSEKLCSFVMFLLNSRMNCY